MSPDVDDLRRWTQIAIGFLPLALAARRTRSIYVSMIAHVTVNMVFLVMLTASFAAGTWDLHRCAFYWFMNNGFLDEAIARAIAAGEIQEAAGLMQSAAKQLVMRGASATLQQGWLAKLPHESIIARPRLVIAECWA